MKSDDALMRRVVGAILTTLVLMGCGDSARSPRASMSTPTNPSDDSSVTAGPSPTPATGIDGSTCTSSPPPTTDDTGRPIARIEADLDADGRPDQVVSYVGPAGGVYQAVLGNGETTDPQTSKDVFPDEGYGEELLGVHDFNSDGRDEVLLRAGGNTADGGGIARLKDCQLVGLDDSARDVTFTFRYGAHSNCCPDTRVLVTCEGARLVEVTSEPDATPEEYNAMTDAQRAQLRRTWERNVYLVGATSAHRISHTTGRTGPGKDVIPAGQSGVRC